MGAEPIVRVLLPIVGTVCLLAIIPVAMPREWMVQGQRLLGMGQFPDAPIAEYLARFTSALCAFYGGLVWSLSFDVRRFAPVIQYQAMAMMATTAAGVAAALAAGLPAGWVIADAAAGWALLVPMLILVRQWNANSTATP
jgi:hypothetical protein